MIQGMHNGFHNRGNGGESGGKYRLIAAVQKAVLFFMHGLDITIRNNSNSGN